MSAAGPPPGRGWIGRIAVVTALVVAVAGAVVVWASPVLGLQAIRVEGPAAADLAAPVRAAVHLAQGTPLARIDPAAVRRRVLAVGPVATASVQRQWPNTLRIVVTERLAVAATQANGHWWLLDATGLPFRQVDSLPPGLMPLELVTPGPHDRATLAAIAVLRSLVPGVRAQVRAVVARTGYDVTLDLTDGRTVLWGSPTLPATKTEVLTAMLQRPGTVFDISDPTLVTVRGG